LEMNGGAGATGTLRASARRLYELPQLGYKSCYFRKITVP
jgi:hypothetical protein